MSFFSVRTETVGEQPIPLQFNRHEAKKPPSGAKTIGSYIQNFASRDAQILAFSTSFGIKSS